MTRDLHVTLVYPDDQPFRTPGAIGWHASRALRRNDQVASVRVLDWSGRSRVKPVSGALNVLVGHVHPAPMTTMRRSMQLKWDRVVIMQPFNGDPLQVGYLTPWMRYADAFAAICGPEWEDQIDFTFFARWKPIFRRLDLGVDASAFPMRPTISAPSHDRGVLYVGNGGRAKDLPYLQQVRDLMPNTRFGWIGGDGRAKLRDFETYGEVEMSSAVAREIAYSYDVLITLGSADANPTTVLEAQALGLAPVTTRTSGWSEGQGVIHVPRAAPDQVVATLNRVLDWPRQSYESFVLENRNRVVQLYNWDAFTETLSRVVTDLEDRPSVAVRLGREQERLARLSTLMSRMKSPTWAAPELGHPRARALARRLLRPTAQ